MKEKNIAIISLILGVLNCLMLVVNRQWYMVVCYIVLGLGPILYAIKYFSNSIIENFRSLAWVDFMFGVSILSLAMSTFYGSGKFVFLQYIIGALLVVISIIALVKVVKEHRLSLIP
ncbi:MAG: hypothetical protein GXY89_01820 [Tissierellia bacterium]|nr:hypothetical protein [Tissierellia bacterium]